MSLHRIEDPYIATTARLEFIRVRGRIEAGLARGEPFFLARERVLAEEVPDLTHGYGKDVANRVTRAIEAMDPMTGLSPQGQAAVKARSLELVTAHRLAHSGRARLPWWDRLSIALTGVPL